jgi:acetyl-CoA C-acetyltransferase
MTRRSAIVATGQTYFGKRDDVSIPEMVREAVDRCFAVRDVTARQVDAVVVGNMELFEGIHFPEQWMVDALGMAGKPVYKVNTGGTVGASVAVMCDYLIGAGIHDVVLGIGYQKQSEGNPQGNITTVGDPTWERSVMAGAIGNFAVMASQYLDRSDSTPEHAAMAAVKSRRNAVLNPYAHLKMPDITVEQVSESKVLAWPVRMLDMCPSSDGAAAALFVSEDRATNMAPRPAWVASTYTAHDTQFMGDSPYRLAEMRSLQVATRKVYERAGITDPREWCGGDGV